MIELSPATGVMLYLGATLVIVLGLWVYQHYFSRHKKIIIIPKELLVCEYCHFAYLGEIGKPVNQCPQCRSYNKKNVYDPDDKKS